MLSSLFGKPKTERISPAETIKALNETIIDLEKREKFLESKAKKELEKARENRNKNKKGVYSDIFQYIVFLRNFFNSNSISGYCCIKEKKTL